MTPGHLVVPVQPDGNYPDIEPVMKHSDVQRGIGPIYHWRGLLYTRARRIKESPPGGGGGGGRGATRPPEVEPVVVRVVEVAVGAEVWAVKAVKVVEMRWSELPDHSHGPALCSSLSESRALSASGSQGRRFYRVRAPVLAGSAPRAALSTGRHCPRRSKRKRPVLSLGP
jgi:hypothetical protein